MSTQGKVDKLICMALLPDKAIQQEVDDARWADYGRSIYCNLLDSGKLERVLNRASMKPDQTVKGIAQAIRVYLTTGTMPS